jgi:hypothetical protein
LSCYHTSHGAVIQEDDNSQGKTKELRRENFPSASWPTTNFTLSHLGLNLGLLSEKLVSSCLSYGTVYAHDMIILI